jgi:hypothetical protein
MVTYVYIGYFLRVAKVEKYFYGPILVVSLSFLGTGSINNYEK